MDCERSVVAETLSYDNKYVAQFAVLIAPYERRADLIMYHIEQKMCNPAEDFTTLVRTSKFP